MGSKVSFHVFGIGVQIYRWNGTKWDFVNPPANLFTDAGGKGLGRHALRRPVSGSGVLDNTTVIQ